MKPLILIISLAGLTVFIWQNQKLISLIFLNTNIAIQLPVAVWIVLFVGAGILTSIVWQFLNNLQIRAALRSASEEKPEVYFSEPRSSDYQRPPRSNPRNFSNSDWNTTDDLDWDDSGNHNQDDWNIEEPPVESTYSKDDFDDRREEEGKNYEVRQQPQSISHSGSVYSYSYREKNDTSTDNKKPVYDADYRVITPPYQENLDESIEDYEEDNDWI